MGKITFVLGGARSGKSRYAAGRIKNRNKKTAFVATGQALDGEMRRRIAVHKKERPSHWTTFEEPLRLPSVLKKVVNGFDY
ncbi:MAG TPA: bifunctional adenosylcobinamide kinase/adenosylcobinamide-phosphate guanylyltransferase, partial [Elusimicrobiota bacterium]|nr:bifunctional adenosylcobinamide kinase/adenosylcobinamide-phosphate guanylyltransferase [Elusimicrobiota bacterium]